MGGSGRGNPRRVFLSQPLQCVRKAFYKGLYLNHLPSVFKNTKMHNWDFFFSHKRNSWMLVGGWPTDWAGLAGAFKIELEEDEGLGIGILILLILMLILLLLLKARGKNTSLCVPLSFCVFSLILTGFSYTWMMGLGDGGVPELSLTFDFLSSPACRSKAPRIFCLSCIPPFSILTNSSAFLYRPIQLSLDILHADSLPSLESPLPASGSGRSCKDASVSSKPPAADPSGRPSGWSLGETEALFPPGRALRRKSTRPGCWVAP